LRQEDDPPPKNVASKNSPLRPTYTTTAAASSNLAASSTTSQEEAIVAKIPRIPVDFLEDAQQNTPLKQITISVVVSLLELLMLRTGWVTHWDL
jgi:hypothetical protein